MARRFLTASLMFILTGFCAAQRRGGSEADMAEPLIMSVLRKANVSGSLEYWGRCDAGKALPDYPKLKPPRDSAGGPLEALSEMFADDPMMLITQQADGTIRMVETDVPRDLLDVSISRISFDGGVKKTRTLPEGPEKSEPRVGAQLSQHRHSWLIPFSSPSAFGFCSSGLVKNLFGSHRSDKIDSRACLDPEHCASKGPRQEPKLF